MSDAAAATSGGVSFEIDMTKGLPDPLPQDTEKNKLFMESVPSDYKEKEWVTKLSQQADPLVEMFKQFDNQLSLIGRKAEGLRLPGENATEEDWKSFHKAIGVPDAPDKYEYIASEVSEDLKPYFKQDDALLATMKEAALKAGVRPEGFKHLAEAFDKYYVAELQKTVAGMNDALAKLENGFKSKFGERSNQVLENWQKSFTGLLGKEQAAVIENLDPAVKVVLAEHFDSFAKQYIREDSLDLHVPSGSHQMTEAEYGDEYARLFAKVRSAKPGSSELIEAKRQLTELQAKGKDIFK